MVEQLSDTRHSVGLHSFGHLYYLLSEHFSYWVIGSGNTSTLQQQMWEGRKYKQPDDQNNCKQANCRANSSRQCHLKQKESVYCKMSVMVPHSTRKRLLGAVLKDSGGTNGNRGQWQRNHKAKWEMMDRNMKKYEIWQKQNPLFSDLNAIF